MRTLLIMHTYTHPDMSNYNLSPALQVGKYFTRFTRKRYIPNAPVREAYPDGPDDPLSIIKSGFMQLNH